MEATDIRTQGDTFFLSFLAAFVFIYFGIVLKPVNSQVERQRAVAISSQRSLVRVLNEQIALKFPSTRLDPEQLQMLTDEKVGSQAQSSSNKEFDPVAAQQVAVHKRRSMTNAELKKEVETLKEKAEITEHLAKASADLATMVSESAKDNSHTIPFLSISIPESTILSLFPLGVFAGLLRLLYFRRLFLEKIINHSDRMPIWAGPLPTFMFDRSKTHWLIVNTSLLTIVILCILFTGDYLVKKSVGDKDRLTNGFIQLWAVVGFLTVGVYFIIVGKAFMDSKPNTTEYRPPLEIE